MDQFQKDWVEAKKIGAAIGSDPKEILISAGNGSQPLWSRLKWQAKTNPEKISQDLRINIARACAWHGETQESAEIITTLPPSKHKLQAIKTCTWLAGGAQPAPGLLKITRHAGEDPEKDIKAASIWKATNQETEERRKCLFLEAHPDYTPTNKKWGEILLKAIQKEGIDLKQPPMPPPNKIDKTTTILGENHANLETGDFLIKEIEQAEPNTLITIEEPQDGSWAPVMAFLTKTKKHWSNSEVLAAAQKEMGNAPASRVAAIACAYRSGLEVAFVDLPSKERARRYQKETSARKRRVAFGIPFDLKNPTSVQGGPRTLAATILWGYHNAQRRSRSMSQEIARIQNGRPLIHIGGALHAEDIAQELSRLRPSQGTPKIIFGTSLENPLLDALGKTRNAKSLTNQKKDPMLKNYEQSL